MTAKNYVFVCDGFYENFMRIVSFKIIFSMKRGYVYVWETCEFCGCVFQRDYKCYCFFEY